MMCYACPPRQGTDETRRGELLRSGRPDISPVFCVIVRLVFLPSGPYAESDVSLTVSRAIWSARMSTGPDKRRPEQVPARTWSGTG